MPWITISLTLVAKIHILQLRTKPSAIHCWKCTKTRPYLLVETTSTCNPEQIHGNTSTWVLPPTTLTTSGRQTRGEKGTLWSARLRELSRKPKEVASHFASRLFRLAPRRFRPAFRSRPPPSLSSIAPALSRALETDIYLPIRPKFAGSLGLATLEFSIAPTTWARLVQSTLDFQTARLELEPRTFHNL